MINVFPKIDKLYKISKISINVRKAGIFNSSYIIYNNSSFKNILPVKNSLFEQIAFEKEDDNE